MGFYKSQSLQRSDFENYQEKLTNLQKKLTNLRKQQERKIDKSTTTYAKNTVHNFSSYQLTTEDYAAHSYGLDHHIPCKFNSNRIHTKFEQFYQSILKYISHI